MTGERRDFDAVLTGFERRGLITANITFNVEVGCGFVGATVAGVYSHVVLCCFLDDQQALLAV